MTAAGPRHVYEVIVRSDPQRLWRAIVDPAQTVHYFYATRVDSTFEVGAPIAWRAEDGTAAVEGVVFECEPPARLVHSFMLMASEAACHDRPSRVTWEIDALGESCRLTLVHDEFESETATFREVGRGWSPVLAGLKHWLETGQPLAPPR